MTDPLPFRTALAVLIVVQTIMLGALYAGVPPHPPARIAPFAMAPFLAAAIAAALAAALMAERRLPALMLGGLAALMALVSFGPHKYVDPAFPQIWPGVLAAQAAVLTLLVQALPALRSHAEARA